MLFYQQIRRNWCTLDFEMIQRLFNFILSGGINVAIFSVQVFETVQQAHDVPFGSYFEVSTTRIPSFLIFRTISLRLTLFCVCMSFESDPL